MILKNQPFPIPNYSSTLSLNRSRLRRPPVAPLPHLAAKTKDIMGQWFLSK
jgi:hypothetical protein